MRSLSIVVPAWNEADRIGATLERLVAWARSLPEWQILVVDDGSTDATAHIAGEWRARDARVKVISLDRNRGKGYCVRTGMLAADGDVRLFCDADLSTPIEHAEALFARIRDGADIAIGSRNGASRDLRHRRTMGRAFNLVVRALVLPRIGDTQCGFKMFSAHAARATFERARIDGFAFDVEILRTARELGLRIDEVPVTCKHSPPSKVDLVRDGGRMLRDVVRIRRAYGKG